MAKERMTQIGPIEAVYPQPLGSLPELAVNHVMVFGRLPDELIVDLCQLQPQTSEFEGGKTPTGTVGLTPKKMHATVKMRLHISLAMTMNLVGVFLEQLNLAGIKLQPGSEADQPGEVKK